MKYDTPRWKPPAAWFSGLFDWIDARVTAPIDDDAVRRGWTVHRLPGSRTQVYRDPRWDRRRTCDSCEGSGLDGARSCAVCDASGVVTDGSVAQPGSVL